jgi:hypothetical protein
MDPKPRPHHDVYLGVLRGMTPQQRLDKAFELTASARRLFRDGLRQRFPHLSEPDLHRLYLERLDKCHNRNY